MTTRHNQRLANQLRQATILTDFLPSAKGSVLISMGQTQVICTATLENTVPPFLQGTGQGWVTAEYGMLPRSTPVRMRREAAVGKQSGRTVEIQRIIGRSLRAAIDLSLLGERQIIIDCDVISADGGTRTASITGGFVALALACEDLVHSGHLTTSPIKNAIAAISVGMVDGQPLIDLDYSEDSHADSDINIVMNRAGELIEIQGTSEKSTFTPNVLTTLLTDARAALETLFVLQENAIAQAKSVK